MALGAYSLLSGDETYMDKAREYAKQWEIDAKASHDATRLTFDEPDGWSLKYNMVWDGLLQLNLFSDEVKQNETDYYMGKMNKYGVPLDCRKDYTKLDWLMWSTKIVDNKEYFDKVCRSVMDMINDTMDRVPLTDWYDTTTARHVEFQHRSVVGGLYIHLLK